MIGVTPGGSATGRGMQNSTASNPSAASRCKPSRAANGLPTVRCASIVRSMIRATERSVATNGRLSTVARSAGAKVAANRMRHIASSCPAASGASANADCSCARSSNGTRSPRRSGALAQFRAIQCSTAAVAAGSASGWSRGKSCRPVGISNPVGAATSHNIRNTRRMSCAMPTCPAAACDRSTSTRALPIDTPNRRGSGGAQPPAGVQRQSLWPCLKVLPPRLPAAAPSLNRNALSLMNPCASTWS